MTKKEDENAVTETERQDIETVDHAHLDLLQLRSQAGNLILSINWTSQASMVQDVSRHQRPQLQQLTFPSGPS